MGEAVEFPSNGSTAGGYLATGAGAGPAVVVVQEWWGLVPHITDLCDRFAAEGFTALAPDLYHGKKVPNSEPDEAQKALMALDTARAARDLSGAVDFLAGHAAVRGEGVGVIGFCMGGGLAMALGAHRPDAVRAVVPFYGPVRWADDAAEWDNLRAPVEGHYGEADEGTLPSAAVIEEQLRQRGRDVRIYRYPAARHAFFNDTRPETYDEEAAREAWVRTLEFLRAKLG